jgi:RHS repeat-associated protein
MRTISVYRALSIFRRPGTTRRVAIAAVLAVVASGLTTSGARLPAPPPLALASLTDCASAATPVTAPAASTASDAMPAYQVIVQPSDPAPRTISYGGATLVVKPGSVLLPTGIGITPLGVGQVPKLDSGMTNVTAKPRGGYRFTPHPMTFAEDLTVSLPYDPALLDPDFTAQDIYTYFYDDVAACWQPLERVSVDEVSHVVTSLTNHFTDMINATVVVPEHPEGASFNPNQIKGIQAADPGTGVNLIAPPAANNQGDNRLSYPIQIPAGRAGLQPQLAVTYNSSAPNGWMGLGWDLPMQAVMIDTRWGVPRYAASQETETYTVNGEQLTPVAHRGPLQPRSAEKVFHTRVEGGFARIVRHGNAPANYTWEITDKAGTHWLYGGDAGGPAADSTLADGSGNVFLWALREVRDAHGNVMRYHTARVDDPGIAGGTEPGRNLYLQRITYTGENGAEGRYAVTFVRDRELGEPLRADATIDARGGFKRVTADLLRRVDVTFDGNLVRRYGFDYTTGAFFKTLLHSVSQYDSNGVLFNTHRFDYFDDIRDGQGHYQAFDLTNWNSPGDGLSSGALNLTPSQAGDASALSANTSTGGGGHLYVGVGTTSSKSNSVGVKVGFEHSAGEGLLALLDVDGDNLPDKVFRKGGSVQYRKNLSGPAGQPQFAAEAKPLNLPGIMGESSNSLTVGIEGYLSGVAAQLDYVNTFAATDQYFSDVNGDGIADLVNGSGVLFGRIGADGTPVYGISADTPVPVHAGPVDPHGVFGDFSADRDRLAGSFPLLDTVRRWVAPFDGTVQVQGAVKLADETAAARAASATADGVRVAIQHESTELFATQIGPRDNTAHTPTGVDAIAVSRGDRLYFRVQSGFDGSLDLVSWDPTVSYVGAPATADVNGLPAYTYQASRDFTLGGRAAQVRVPLTGTMHLAGDLHKRAATSDDVTVVITRNGSPVFQQTLAGAATGTVPVNLDVPVQQGQTLAWRVKVDSPIDLGRLDWVPQAYYTAADGVDRVTDAAGNPLIAVNPPYELDMYPADDLTAPQGFLPVTADGQLSVDPSLAFDFGTAHPTAKVAFTVKRRGQLLAKRFFDITAGQVGAPDPVTVDANAGDELFFDFSTTDPTLRQFLTSQSVQVGGQPVPSAFHSAAVEGAFPQPYRGWAAIGYNGNGTRATAPIAQGDLVIDEHFRDQLPSTVDPQAQKDAFAADPRVTPPNIAPFSPSPRLGRWGSGEHSFVTADTASSSRLGTESIGLPQTSDLADATAVPRLSRSQQISLTGSVGGGVGNLGGSIATGDSTGQVDFVDLNGDQFPDVVGADGIQYSDPTGGLGSTRGSTPDGAVRKSTNVAGNASAGSAAKTISTGRGYDSPPAHVPANTAEAGNDMPPLGVGGSIGGSKSDGAFDLLDLNGDGLPDRVYSDGRVRLNLGYRFGAPEAWRNPAPINDGSGSNVGVNIGFNTDFYGFAGGASYSEGSTSTAASLMDMNGDGLLDRVFAGNPLRVALNTGNGFEPAVPFNGSLSGLNGDQNAKLGGGAYFTFGICLFAVAVCIVINPGADVSTGASRTEQELRDINGDGFADQLSSTRDNQLVVAENQTGRTNLLRSVTRPMGARMDFDYTRDGNTYNQPQSRWTLSRVAVDDGHPGDGQDVQLATYEYANGVFDRLEREFDGYATVTERQRDHGAGDAVYRSVTREYRTDGHYTRGLLTRTLSTDAAGHPFLETLNTYTLRDVANPAAPADARSTTATVFPQLSRIDHRFFEGQASPGKSTFTTMEYDAFGNMTRSLDAADTGTADDVDTRIRYSAEDPACQGSHILGIPDAIDVTGGGALMRHRESTVDCASGDVTQVRARLANGDVAVTDLDHFGNGNLRSVTSPPNQRGQRYKLDYTYDSTVDSYVESITDSFGLRSAATHNFTFGLVESTTDFNNQVVRNSYDPVGRLDTVVGPYEAADHQVTIDFEYHPEASVPYAVTRHIDRQADGSVRPDTIDTITFADGLNRPIQVKKDASIFAGPDTPAQEAMIVSGRMTLDFLGRTVDQFYPTTEPKGAGNTTFDPTPDTVQPTRTSYDVLDRITRTVLPDSTVSTLAYGFGADRAGTTQFETVATDANGKSKRTYTDTRQLTTAIKEFNPAGGQPVIWTSYGYDPLRELTSIVDDHHNTTTAAYDNLGRRTVLDSPDAGRTQTVYDLTDNPIQKITAKLAATNQAIAYDYDFNRVAAIRYPVFTANNVTYTYGPPGAPNNAAGRITNITDGAGTVAREYGPLGELTKETRTSPAQGSHIQTFTTQYRYDTWNRMLAMTYPDGEVLSYRYDSGGQVNSATGVKGTFSYPYLTRLDYDKFGQRALLDTGNGTRTQYTYNADDRRLANVKANLAQGYVFQNLNYGYDDVGNVTSIANDTQAPTGPEVGMQVGGPSTQHFGYDDLYQLTHADGTYQPRTPRTDQYSTDLTYDSIHNVTAKNQVHQFVSDGNTTTDGKTTYNYAYSYGGAKPHAASITGPYTFNYDANGNQISRDQQPNPRRQMIWDEENRLACSHENVQSSTLPQTPASCDNAGGTPNDARYFYDDQGNRVVKDGAQFHVYPNQNFSTNGVKQFKHIYIGDTKLVTKFVEPPNRVEDRQFYSHADHLGSTGFVTDTSGGLAEHLQYFPGGETWVSEHPSQPVPQQYTGKELDPETNLYYFGARYYDPRTQVWQTPDPALDSYLDGKPNGGVYSSANLASYTYAENRPVNYVDPDGQVAWKEFAWGVAKGAAVGVVAGVAIGALIASGGTLAPAIGYAAIAVGTVMTAETAREVVTGRDLSGNKLSEEQRSDMAGQLVGGALTAGVGGRVGVRLGGRIAAARAPSVPVETARLTARADELAGALDPVAQNHRTAAALSTREGPDVLGGGKRDLSPAQRALAQGDDVLAKSPGDHAEITVLKGAAQEGLTPRGLGTSRDICPDCAAALEEAGATITGPRSAWWFDVP